MTFCEHRASNVPFLLPRVIGALSSTPRHHYSVGPYTNILLEFHIGSSLAQERTVAVDSFPPVRINTRLPGSKHRRVRSGNHQVLVPVNGIPQLRSRIFQVRKNLLRKLEYIQDGMVGALTTI